MQHATQTTHRGTRNTHLIGYASHMTRQAIRNQARTRNTTYEVCNTQYATLTVPHTQCATNHATNLATNHATHRATPHCAIHHSRTIHHKTCNGRRSTMDTTRYTLHATRLTLHASLMPRQAIPNTLQYASYATKHHTPTRNKRSIRTHTTYVPYVP